jgi:glycolate oxidase FAD binding subunit
MPPSDPPTILRPRDPEELRATVDWALNDGVALDIEGRGSKRAYGPPGRAAHVLSLAGIDGVVDYQPEELVLTVKAGTALREVEALLAQRRQMLAFEPADLGAILGGPAGEGTLAGAVMCNLAGPRRISAGAARDHFLGFQGVNGRAERFKSGSKMVKNVTGYDLSKLMAGSLGTLAALDEITVKVVPAPEKVHTLLLVGLDDAAAVAALCEAMGSPHEVSGAAHLPAGLAVRSGIDLVARQGGAVTAIRVEGVAPSVAARLQALRAQFAPLAPAMEELHTMRSRAFWEEVRDVRLLAPGATAQSVSATLLWKVSCPPTGGAAFVAAMRRHRPEAQAMYDWSGGLVWLALAPGDAATDDAAHAAVRAALPESGGHATLVRAPEPVRARVPVFQPAGTALAALSRRVKESFDPGGIFTPGRLG